jgi:hypothetical protein
MSEHTHPGPAQPRTADDLQKITGIGPVLAKRLREAGITSYQDLATIRAERIAELLGGGGGISVERITSQDWAGQAQRLAGSATANPLEHQRYATFHVELLIDSDGEVRRTKVRHYQTDSEDNWAGWDQEQLAAVIAGRAGLTFTQVSPGGSGTRNGSGRADVREPATGPGISHGYPPRPKAAPSRQPSPPPHIHVDGPRPTGAGPQRNFRNENQPFQVLVTVRAEPADATSPDDLDLSVEIMSRTAGTGIQHLLGTVRKIIDVAQPFDAELTVPPLPPGLHTLHAVVTVYPRDYKAEDELLCGYRNQGELVYVIGQVGRDAAT